MVFRYVDPRLNSSIYIVKNGDNDYIILMLSKLLVLGDGLHMATMLPPPPTHTSQRNVFLGLGYTEHEIEC